MSSSASPPASTSKTPCSNVISCASLVASKHPDVPPWTAISASTKLSLNTLQIYTSDNDVVESSILNFLKGTLHCGGFALVEKKKYKILNTSYRDRYICFEFLKGKIDQGK